MLFDINKMTHTFIVDKPNKTFQLHSPIDNSAGNKKMRLLSVSLPLRFFNVRDVTTVQWADARNSRRSNVRKHQMNPGVYYVDGIIREIDYLEIDGLSFSWNPDSHKLFTTVGQSLAIRLNKIGEILGLPRGWITNGQHISYPIADTIGTIMIYCDQISMHENFYNGNPSTILGNIPLSGVDRNYYNQVAAKEYTTKPGVNLTNGVINELKFQVKDCNECPIVDDQLKMVLNIEII